MIFIISTSYQNINSVGSYFWGEKYFPQIENYIPQNISEVITITEAILYFNKSNLKENPPLKLKITKTHITRLFLKIEFKVIGQLDDKSYRIRNALKEYFNIKSLLDLPYCAAVDEKKFFDILKSQEIYSDINQLQLNNNWNAIYALLKTFEPLEKSEIWNNAELLNKFSFATAKLSECNENLKKKFPEVEKRKEFLKQKKSFRKLTIKLRERCIQISPDNASYTSNLAYTYYQSVNELNMPNGRRDGNLFNNAVDAIKYFDLALSIDKTRITDLYRKAIVLTEILPQYLTYKTEETKRSDEISIIPLPGNLQNTIDMIKAGLSEFIKLTEIYESLFIKENNSKIQQTDSNHHYKKYYIKSLYHIAQNNLKLYKSDFNLMNLLYGYKPIDFNNTAIDEKITLLNYANYYIDKCITKDYSKKKEEKFLIDLVECNNFVSAVYKAYLKAKIETHLFLITDKQKHLLTAKEFFHKAMEMNFPQNQRNQNKIFIIEKIATLNLIEGKYDAAIKLLEPVYNKSHQNKKILFPVYCAFTLALSFLLAGVKKEAAEIIKQFKDCGNKIFEYKFNKLNEYLNSSVKYESNRNSKFN